MSLNVKAIKDAFAQDNGHADFDSMSEHLIGDILPHGLMDDFTDALLEFITDHGDEFWED